MTEVEENKAIHIIAIPRSGSTLFMRVIAEALGDATIYSEPGVATFASDNDPKWISNLGKISPDLETFEKVEQTVLKELQNRPVVVKDVIHTVRDFLVGRTDKKSILVTNPNTQYVLLFRNPYSVAVSLSRIGELSSFVPGFISFEYLYDLYSHLVKVAIQKPIVVNADTFFVNFSSDKVKTLLNSMGVRTSTKSLENFRLKSLTTDEAIKIWSDPSNRETFIRWHGRAASATKIEDFSTYAVEKDGPTFEEIDPEFRDSYRKLYEENMVFYKLLLNLALQF